LFGLAIASVYGLLFVLHVVYGLFIALAAVSDTHGIALYVSATVKARKPVAVAASAMETM